MRRSHALALAVTAFVAGLLLGGSRPKRPEPSAPPDSTVRYTPSERPIVITQVLKDGPVQETRRLVLQPHTVHAGNHTTHVGESAPGAPSCVVDLDGTHIFCDQLRDERSHP